MFDVCGRTWFAARYVVRIRTSSITPLTFTPCTAGSRSLRNHVYYMYLLRTAASLCCIHVHIHTVHVHEEVPRYSLPMEHSNCTAAATYFPVHTAAVKHALDFTCGSRQIIMGTGTAAHYTADDTGRDEVMSEHVPLPTGGIGRKPLVPLQMCKKKWAAAYRIRKSVVFLHAPRAGCCP